LTENNKFQNSDKRVHIKGILHVPTCTLW